MTPHQLAGERYAELLKLEKENTTLRTLVEQLKAKLARGGQSAGGDFEPGKIDCEACEGFGKVDAYCNDCLEQLTEANVSTKFGEEGDDICRKCATIDTASMAHEGKH